MKCKLSGVIDLNDHGAFFRIAVRGESHRTRDSGKVFNDGQGIFDFRTVGLDVSGQTAGIFDGLDHHADRVPGKGGNIVRGLPIGGHIGIDKGFGGTLGTGSCVMG